MAKLQLAFWCNWLWEALRLCRMWSLQDASYKHDRPKSCTTH